MSKILELEFKKLAGESEVVVPLEMTTISDVTSITDKNVIEDIENYIFGNNKEENYMALLDSDYSFFENAGLEVSPLDLHLFLDSKENVESESREEISKSVLHTKSDEFRCISITIKPDTYVLIHPDDAKKAISGIASAKIKDLDKDGKKSKANEEIELEDGDKISFDEIESLEDGDGEDYSFDRD